MNQCVKRVIVTIVVLAAGGGPLVAQESRERLLAQGWADLAAGRHSQAAQAASQVLKGTPRDHDAASLAVSAILAGGGRLQALDLYERWLTATRREDAFLLEDIAKAELRALSRTNDGRVHFAALGLLARAGHEAASAELTALANDPTLPLEAEAALARAGNPVGLQRLKDRIAAGGPQDKSFAIRALLESGQPGVAPAIAEGLKDGAPSARITAASALIELKATEALPQLRAAASDPEPPVRAMVQVALGVLGDPAGRQALANLAASPLPDFRLIAARYEADRNPQGSWTAVPESLLSDPDPLIRLKAAELLVSRGRLDAVEAVLSTALNEPSAPVRTAAARLLASLPHDDRGYRLIRRMLRDGLPEVRFEAARALVAPRP